MKASVLCVGLLAMALQVHSATVYTWSDEDGSCVLGSGEDAVAIESNGGSLSIVGSRRTFVYLGEYLPSAKQGTWRTVLENVNLSDVEVHSTHFSNPEAHPGGKVSGWISGTAFPYFASTDEEGVVSVYLMLADSVYTKGARVLLKQDGANVVGQIAWAGFTVGNFTGHLPGSDDSQIWTDANIVTAADGTGGYGVDHLVFVLKDKTDRPVVRVTPAETLTSLSVTGGVEVVVSGDALPDGTLPSSLSVSDARLVVEVGDANVEFSGTCTGVRGRVAFSAVEDAAPPAGYTFETNKVLSTSLADCVIANTRLSAVTNVIGWMGGSQLYPPSRDYHLSGLFFENDGKTATCQFQAKSGNFVKCVLMELKQVGDDIQVRTPATRYNDYTKDGFTEYSTVGSYRFTQYNGYAQGGAVGLNGYCITNIVLQGLPQPSYVALKGTFAANAQLELSVAGSTTRSLVAEATTAYALPRTSAGLVDVCTNATLMLGIAGGGTARLNVERGGLVENWGHWGVGKDQSVTIDGGRMRFNAGGSLTYQWKVSYRDGGETFGNDIRFGDGNNGTVAVFGDIPCLARNAFLFYSSSARTHTFDVSDVTKSAAADFTVTGRVAHCDAVNTNSTIVKTGFGTMRLEGPFTIASAPLQLQAGVLQLGASDVLGADIDLSFSGGSLSADATTCNNCGTVAFAKSASIDVGVGATLALAGVSSWNDSAYVSVTLGEGAALRIGTGADLSSAQLSRITVNGARAVQDEEGYVSARPAGLVFILK